VQLTDERRFHEGCGSGDTCRVANLLDSGAWSRPSTGFGQSRSCGPDRFLPMTRVK